MNPGELNKRIEIWGKTEVETALKENSYKEDCLKRCWARIIPKTGSLISGRPVDTIVSKTTHIVKIRYSSLPTLKEDNWIIFNGHRFDIDYILNPYFKNELYEIFVHEVIE